MLGARWVGTPHSKAPIGTSRRLVLGQSPLGTKRPALDVCKTAGKGGFSLLEISFVGQCHGRIIHHRKKCWSPPTGGGAFSDV